ncbi:MAG: hypothetical protein IJ867_06360 [Clostridia bacterium]|nr:hypothetical protein [Clostridia bacterium]
MGELKYMETIDNTTNNQNAFMTVSNILKIARGCFLIIAGLLIIRLVFNIKGKSKHKKIKICMDLVLILVCLICQWALGFNPHVVSIGGVNVENNI